MNKTSLENQLDSARVKMATVDKQLNRRIMNSVSRVPSRQRTPWYSGFRPFTVAGSMASMAAVLIWISAGQQSVHEAVPTMIAVDDSAHDVNGVKQQVADLRAGISLPEAALRKELQSLESDFKRFYPRS